MVSSEPQLYEQFSTAYSYLLLFSAYTDNNECSSPNVIPLDQRDAELRLLFFCEDTEIFFTGRLSCPSRIFFLIRPPVISSMVCLFPRSIDIGVTSLIADLLSHSQASNVYIHKQYFPSPIQPLLNPTMIISA